MMTPTSGFTDDADMWLSFAGKFHCLGNYPDDPLNLPGRPDGCLTIFVDHTDMTHFPERFGIFFSVKV